MPTHTTPVTSNFSLHTSHWWGVVAAMARLGGHCAVIGSGALWAWR
ncbi:hypothetical protein EDD90_0450 [Streptomyces sp. Ag109_O5-1]|nr:hypothetical protein EDD90_0450 [Streptomyces sp. Ag109_O5-1]